MDKDVTGLEPFISSWFPTKVKEVVEPVISNAEQTIRDAQQHAYNLLRQGINKSQIALTSAQTQVMNNIDDNLIRLEGSLDQTQRNVLQRIEARFAPIEQVNPIQPPIPPHIGGTCLVHLLPDPEKGIYLTVCHTGSGALVYPKNYCPQGLINSITFERWWQAELACRLLDECKQTWDWLEKYKIVISQVQLASNQQGLLPICPNAVLAIETFFAQNYRGI